MQFINLKSWASINLSPSDWGPIWDSYSLHSIIAGRTRWGGYFTGLATGRGLVANLTELCGVGGADGSELKAALRPYCHRNLYLYLPTVGMRIHRKRRSLAYPMGEEAVETSIFSTCLCSITSQVLGCMRREGSAGGPFKWI